MILSNDFSTNYSFLIYRPPLKYSSSFDISLKSTITFLNCNVINYLQKERKRGGREGRREGRNGREGKKNEVREGDREGGGDSFGWRIKTIINVMCKASFSNVGGSEGQEYCFSSSSSLLSRRPLSI